ncbi:PepSY-associated TM helix domain-containing protein [Hymenobacter volaticus]|uniref:PepSY domain-containing protein n=1 Tax=Hymenobacter volaticus TaxID=2932254 RepID=A0ABY4GDK9_9BACT|nr:PepSY-associated TM helix domain-containing protein [Hymenobacter volaticus]UOQ68842.1 PepSY domain-containing protein [Hymenobacter volaticus]
METIIPRHAAPTRPAWVRRYVQRNIYRWHRFVGLLTLVPVICWTLSGLLHPLMSNWLRPSIAKEALPPQPAPRPTWPLQQVLAQHHLSSLRSVRLVRWRQQPAYQVQTGLPTAEPRYFSATTGQALAPDADRQYAEQLARYFTQDSTARLLAAEQLTGFSDDYSFVNRLLPVWKLTFERPGVRTVYVETMPARLAAFNNPTRATFLRFFALLHSWSWLELLANNTVRVIVMLLLLGIILASTLSGLVLYGLMWGKFRRPRNAQDQVGWLRKYHRGVGLAVALVTFTFAGSGAFHVLLKLHPDERLQFHHAPAIPTSRLLVDVTQLPLDWLQVQQVGLVELNGQIYYQVTTLPAAQQNNKSATSASTGLPEEAVRPTLVTYYSATTGHILADGQTQYATFLANTFWRQAGGGPTPAIDKIESVTHFEGEYGFVNKRLPVMKVAYRIPQQTTLYVEPATGRLAARVENTDRYEGLSFAFLHKYHAVGSLGKNVRDAITMLSAVGVLAVSVLGFWLLVKRK